MRATSARKLRATHLLSTLAVTLIVASGCATGSSALRAYPGEPLPDNQLASLTYAYGSASPSQYTMAGRAAFLHPVWVEKIDGKDHLQLCEESGQVISWFEQHNRYRTEWTLPAGEHTIQVGNVPEYAKVSLYIENRDDLEATIQEFPQVCLGSEDMCLVYGSWELTFTAEPLHSYAIGIEVEESKHIAREETGDLAFLVGNPPWPPGQDWSIRAEEIAQAILGEGIMAGVDLLREHDLAQTGTTTGGVDVHRIRPYLYDLTALGRIGSFERIDRRE